MSVAVIVPYRGGQPERDRNWAWIRHHYETHHPSWPIVVADSPGPWSKGAAVNTAAADTDATVLVIADADSFVPPAALTEAVDLAATVPWVVPHGNVRRLNPHATDQLIAGNDYDRRDLARPLYEGPAGGGIAVLTHDAFDAVGGIDPRFLDWGNEDLCWSFALETLVGHHLRLGADLIHLWHPHPSPDYSKPPLSDHLFAAYVEAQWHPGQMRAVIDGRPYEPPPPLDTPRRFRCPTPVRTLRCGTTKARFRDHIYETTDADMAEAVLLAPNIEEVT